MFRSSYASASAIRLLLKQSRKPCGKNFVSRFRQAAFDALQKGRSCRSSVPRMTSRNSFQFRLLPAIHEQEDLSRFADLSPELAAKAHPAGPAVCSLQRTDPAVKNKRLHLTPRVSRALLHLLLGITKEQTNQARSLGYAPYARSWV